MKREKRENVNEEKIMKVLERQVKLGTFVTPSSIAYGCNKGYEQSSWACRHLKKLVADGLVERNSRGHYRLKEARQIQSQTEERVDRGFKHAEDMGFIKKSELKAQKDARREVFEAEIGTGNESYGIFKLIYIGTGVKTGNITNQVGDRYYFFSCGDVPEWKRFDFATPAERERFENVKREVERKGQKFGGKVADCFEIPDGMKLVYAGEYRQVENNEPHWNGSDNGFAGTHGKQEGHVGVILHLVDDPDYKPEPDSITSDVRLARLSDFRKTVNGVEVLIYQVGDCAYLEQTLGINKTNTGMMLDEAQALACALGVQIAPAGMTDEVKVI